jgi:hypothetical protein
MNDRFCEVCNEYISPVQVHILCLKDDKTSHEIVGHKNCIDELEIKVKSIKNLNKMKVKEILEII